ncbi:MAG TPA: RidA family protein [Thermoleophilia bacterium]
MSRHAIRSAMAPGPTGAASPGVSSGHLVFISAQLPLDLQGEPAGATAAEQAAQAFENLAHQLRSTGLSLEDVVSLEIHLVDEADRAAVDDAIEARFIPPYPALTLSGVPWLPGGARLQVAAIAQRY